MPACFWQKEVGKGDDKKFPSLFFFSGKVWYSIPYYLLYRGVSGAILG